MNLYTALNEAMISAMETDQKTVVFGEVQIAPRRAAPLRLSQLLRTQQLLAVCGSQRKCRALIYSGGAMMVCGLVWWCVDVAMWWC